LFSEAQAYNILSIIGLENFVNIIGENLRGSEEPLRLKA
jgi:hypothetical protein